MGKKAQHQMVVLIAGEDNPNGSVKKGRYESRSSRGDFLLRLIMGTKDSGVGPTPFFEAGPGRFSPC
jgi:hypothetical protein